MALGSWRSHLKKKTTEKISIGEGERFFFMSFQNGDYMSMYTPRSFNIATE